jgi:peptide/nickel transport system substrate-binding protein
MIVRSFRNTLPLLGAVGCLACGGSSAGTVPPSNDLLIVGYDREPDVLNRFSTHILEDIEVPVIEGLTITDEDMNVVPLLAEEVPTLENGGVVLRDDGGMDVIWKIRPGITWHDGTPFTSADIAFTVAAINDPDYNPESTDGFDRITSVDTPDDLTAVVHYREIYAPYAIQFFRGALPKHVLEGRDIDRATDYNRNPLGTGPYRVAEWRTGEYILLEAVPDYWGGDSLPRIRRIMFKFISNTNTRINQLKSGEVHVVATVPLDKVRELEGLDGITLHRMTGNSYEHVTLNQRHYPPFADVRVRQALLHAIDRELIVETILDGLTTVVHGPIQPLSWAFSDAIRQYAFDPERARALLAEAGWTDPDGDGIRQRNGEPFAFTLITHAGNLIRENVAQTIQRMFRDVGVDMRVQLMDPTAISSVWFGGEFDAMLSWWVMPSDPELTLFFASDRFPPRGRNINFFRNDSLTTLLYASDHTVDREERRRLFHEIQRMIGELVPELPLYNVTRVDAIPSNLRGYTGNPTNTGIFWNVQEWDIR